MPKGPSFGKYLLRRIPQGIPLILVVISVNFVLIHAAPGDPAEILAGELPPPEFIERIRREFGLDKPLHEQYFSYLQNVIGGNLGYSYFYRRPVLEIILERAPATVLLMATQLLFASLVGIVFGVFASRRPYSKLDNFVSTTALMTYCFPIFFLGTVLLLVFGLHLGWFPSIGMSTIEVRMNPLARIIDIMRHLILPSLTLGLSHTALIFRLTRSSMIEVLGLDFITTARVKGVKERFVIFRHGLRNALLPIVTVIGMDAGTMIAGAVMTETIFSWPGIGRLLYDSIFARDYPVIMGIFVIVSISVIVANLMTDVICAYLDPKIRYE